MGDLLFVMLWCVSHLKLTDAVAEFRVGFYTEFQTSFHWLLLQPLRSIKIKLNGGHLTCIINDVAAYDLRCG